MSENQNNLRYTWIRLHGLTVNEVSIPAANDEDQNQNHHFKLFAINFFQAIPYLRRGIFQNNPEPGKDIRLGLKQMLYC